MAPLEIYDRQASESEPQGAGEEVPFVIRSPVSDRSGHHPDRMLRDRFQIKPGTTLDWQDDGDSIRVVKRTPSEKTKDQLQWLRRLGRVPAAPRDRRPVESD